MTFCVQGITSVFVGMDSSRVSGRCIRSEGMGRMWVCEEGTLYRVSSAQSVGGGGGGRIG